MKVSVLAAAFCLVAVAPAYGQYNPWQRQIEQRRHDNDAFMRRMEEDRRHREQLELQREQNERLRRIEEEQRRRSQDRKPNSFR